MDQIILIWTHVEDGWSNISRGMDRLGEDNGVEEINRIKKKWNEGIKKTTYQWSSNIMPGNQGTRKSWCEKFTCMSKIYLTSG